MRPPSDPPPSPSALDIVVPAVFGVVGLSVGVLLGRTVFAPKLPVSTVRYAAIVKPGGAVMDPPDVLERQTELGAKFNKFDSGGAKEPKKPTPERGGSGNSAATRIQRLLDTPPSPSELAALAAGPRVIIGSDVPRQVEVLTGLQKTLRAAMAIRFDTPAPLMGTLNLWDYIARHVRTIRLVSDNSASVEANPDTGTVVLPYGMVNSGTYLDMANGGVGTWSVPVILAHEARHIERPDLLHTSDGNGLTCTLQQYRTVGCPPGFGGFNIDPSLSYGGAGAVHYYAIRWLADHSMDWLDEPSRAHLRSRADVARAAMFADSKASAVRK